MKMPEMEIYDYKQTLSVTQLNLFRGPWVNGHGLQPVGISPATFQINTQAPQSESHLHRLHPGSGYLLHPRSDPHDCA